MQKIILQIPLNKKLKDDAEKAACDQGFSSLQEILRVFMRKLANKKIDFSFREEVETLSANSEKRYLKITEEFKKGKNVYPAKNINDLLKQLQEPL